MIRQLSILLTITFISISTSIRAEGPLGEGIWNSPKVFEQNTIYLQKAQSYLESYKDTIDSDKKSNLIGIKLNEVIQDLEYMIENPNSTNLNYTGYYCSVGVVLNWMLNNRPDIYVKSILELSTVGEYIANNQENGVKIPKSLLKIDFSLRDSTGQISKIAPSNISDFILGTTLVNSKKHIQKMGLLWKDALYNKDGVGSFIYGNSAPWEIDNYFEVLGFKVKGQKYYLGCRNTDKTLLELESAIKSGGMPILFENHLITTTRTRNPLYYAIGVHYLTLHDFTIENNLIDLSFWEYGIVSNKREIHRKHNPFAAKNIRIAIRRTKKYNRFVESTKMKKISTSQFLKGLKGYWIIEQN